MRAPALLQPALFLAPALLLWALLALGRYPGEALVARLSRRPSRSRRRNTPPPAHGPAPARRVAAPRNLLARSLAGRAPPLAAHPSE
jgi:hypothetical protein